MAPTYSWPSCAYLITGGAGFIGSHLGDALLGRGDSVIALDNLATGRHDNIREHIGAPNFEFVMGSIINADLVDDLVSRADVVFHLAAAVGVKLIVERPLESLITNIRGSEILLEKAHKYGKKVLITSTSEIYGKSPQIPMHEDSDRLLGSPLVGRWSYSTSKAVDEILAHAYWKAKGLPTVIVRLFNTVGPRQSAEFGMVIPRFIEAALNGRDLLVHGDGSQSRCFGHVKDVVPALMALMECREAEGLAVNIGAQEEVTILDLAKLVIERTGSASQIRLQPYDQVYVGGFEDMPRRVPDTTRAAKLIGFAPKTTLVEIVDSMIEDIRRRK
ncbi:MAG: NAD-dependent epimerase/dehydratase family protein [Actinomycetota bacterium]